MWMGLVQTGCSDQTPAKAAMVEKASGLSQLFATPRLTACWTQQAVVLCRNRQLQLLTVDRVAVGRSYIVKQPNRVWV